jgi:hypothetical protein
MTKCVNATDDSIQTTNHLAASPTLDPLELSKILVSVVWRMYLHLATFPTMPTFSAGLGVIKTPLTNNQSLVAVIDQSAMMIAMGMFDGVAC